MEKKNIYNGSSRRKFLKSVSVIPAYMILPGILTHSVTGCAQSGSRFKGVQIGVIAPFSFRGLPVSIDDILGYLKDLGITSVEMQSVAFEDFAGAPKSPPYPWEVRGQLTPELMSELQNQRSQYALDVRNWRLSTEVMSTYENLRKKFNDEGIDIRLAKFDTFDQTMPPEEIDYCFNAAKALGARAITTGLEAEKARILGPFADKHEFMIGFHNQRIIDPVSTDDLLSFGGYLGLNFDIGHHFAESDIPITDIIERYQDRIVSLHLTDRTKENISMPFGQGETPIVEVLQFCAENKFNFGADIDLEYQIPEGSDPLMEVGKCVQYCKNALS